MGLIRALNQFGLRAQLIGKDAPDRADFCQAVASLLSLSSLQFAYALAKSMERGIFVDGGRQYLAELHLGVQDLFREVSLEGRRFLAVALVDERSGNRSHGPQGGHEL